MAINTEDINGQSVLLQAEQEPPYDAKSLNGQSYLVVKFAPTGGGTLTISVADCIQQKALLV